MMDRTMDVRWHDVIDVVDIEIYDGPDDVLGTRTVVTVICGRITGELDRVVARDEDGQLAIDYEARIDGLGQGTGVAKVESSSAAELESLAVVADFLAREIGKLTGQAQRAGLM
jgi:hypothetical protein